MKQLASETITMQTAPAFAIGMPVGNLGLTDGATSAAAQWLAKRSPVEVDKAVASRAKSLGVALQADQIAKEVPPGITVWVPGRVKVTCEGDSSEALDALRGFMTAAPQRVVEEWLAELSVITARKPGDEFEEALRLRAYADRLAQYPADVARYVCLSHLWRFWPSWAEMAEVCSAMSAFRRASIAMLEREPARRDAESAEEQRQAQIMAEREKRRLEKAAILAEGGPDAVAEFEAAFLRKLQQ